MRTGWLEIVFLQLDGDTELTQAVDTMMVRAKRIYILIIKVNKLFSFCSSWCFLKEIEKCAMCFYRVIETLMKVWENLKKLYGSCSHSISCSPKLPIMFLQPDRNMVHVFYFLHIVHVSLHSKKNTQKLPFLLHILQDQDNETLKEILKSNAEKPVKMLVFSSKTCRVRGTSMFD